MKSVAAEIERCIGFGEAFPLMQTSQTTSDLDILDKWHPDPAKSGEGSSASHFTLRAPFKCSVKRTPSKLTPKLLGAL